MNQACFQLWKQQYSLCKCTNNKLFLISALIFAVILLQKFLFLFRVRNVEEIIQEEDLQGQQPRLEQLGEEKQQVLRNLENRLEEDIHKLVN